MIMLLFSDGPVHEAQRFDRYSHDSESDNTSGPHPSPDHPRSMLLDLLHPDVVHCQPEGNDERNGQCAHKSLKGSCASERSFGDHENTDRTEES